MRIGRIKFRSITPVIINYPRFGWWKIATELRGLARWWLRAILGEKSLISEVIPCIFGKSMYSSPIRIKLIPEKIVRGTCYFEKIYSQARSYCQKLADVIKYHPRQGINRKEKLCSKVLYFEGTLEIFSDIYPRKNGYSVKKLFDDLAIHSILLALSFSGIGYGGRRGLGAMEILKNDTGICHNNTKDLLNRTMALRSKVFDHFLQSPSYMEFPPFPSLSNFHLFEIKIKNNDNIFYKVTQLANLLFMRQYPKELRPQGISSRSIVTLGMLLRGITNPFQPARMLNHYILGLPRFSKGGNNMYRVGNGFVSQRGRSSCTGFYKLGDSSRRASPIILSAKSLDTLTVSIFCSEDWPDEYLWGSTHNNPRGVCSRDSILRKLPCLVQLILSRYKSQFKYSIERSWNGTSEIF